jgi:hypothetical protein
MVTNLFLMGCVLAVGQPPERSDWLLLPRLTRGQEIVYSGSYAEESSVRSVQFSRGYRIECRVLILDTGTKGTDVALYTRLKHRELPGGRTGVSSPAEGVESSSVRVEVAKIDPQGKLTASHGLATVPLEGPPSLECGEFVEAPKYRVGADQTWATAEDGRPAHTWKVAGSEVTGGVRCVKLVGVQQTEDWDKPRADHTAWRRTDTVWLDTAQGIAYRVERVIEQRAPAHKEPTLKSVLRYERETNLQYPRQLFEDRRREVQQAKAFGDGLTPLLPNPTKHKAEIEALLAKIAYHLEHEPPTPYREAILQVKRRAEAARRGEAPPPGLTEPAVGAIATPGNAAPDFVAPDLMTKESSRLRRWLGRPVLMVFYNPTSDAAIELLRFSQAINDNPHTPVSVLTLAITDDLETARRQHGGLRMTVPLLDGSGLRQSFAVEATPKMVVLDSTGVVRATYTGWGTETAAEVAAELKRWLGR